MTKQEILAHNARVHKENKIPMSEASYKYRYSIDEMDALIAAKDQRIAELEACIKKELDIAEEWQAMYALLDRVPHKRRHYIGTECWPDCPACAWAKLKEGK